MKGRGRVADEVGERGRRLPVEDGRPITYMYK